MPLAMLFTGADFFPVAPSSPEGATKTPTESSTHAAESFGDFVKSQPGGTTTAASASASAVGAGTQAPASPSKRSAPHVVSVATTHFAIFASKPRGAQHAEFGWASLEQGPVHKTPWHSVSAQDAKTTNEEIAAHNRHAIARGVMVGTDLFIAPVGLARNMLRPLCLTWRDCGSGARPHAKEDRPAAEAYTAALRAALRHGTTAPAVETM
jgi:hypothetical protein